MSVFTCYINANRGPEEHAPQGFYIFTVNMQVPASIGLKVSEAASRSRWRVPFALAAPGSFAYFIFMCFL